MPLVDMAIATLEDGTPSASQESVIVSPRVISTPATGGTRQTRYLSGDGAKHLLANRYSAVPMLDNRAQDRQSRSPANPSDHRSYRGENAPD
jgi:hypothetical protein